MVLITPLLAMSQVQRQQTHTYESDGYHRKDNEFLDKLNTITMENHLTEDNYENLDSNGVLLYHKTLDGKSKEDILRLAMNCYSHVITGERTFQEWAFAIKENYDLEDERNSVIYQAVNHTAGTVKNYPYTGKTEIKYLRESIK
jgi:hypothetical protein